MQAERKVAAKAHQLRWWQIALISVAVSALGSLSGLQSSSQQRKLYNKKLKQAPWAPPAAVFAPVWMLNNFFILNALKRLLERNIPQKTKMLLLQAGIWTIFFSFNYVYFRKKSPMLADIWTASDHVLAIASILLSYKSDKKTALNYVPLMLWTGYAKSLADYQVLKNPDPVFHTRPLLK